MDNFPKEYEVVPIHVLESGWFVPEGSEKLPFSIESMSLESWSMLSKFFCQNE
jgi:hypothetical protein